MPGEALIIEVTESVLITDAGRDRGRRCSGCGPNGVRVAVDDFGTGYSSLSYLMSLPVDVLKLDRAFVGPEHERRQYAITGAVLQLAAVLDLVTIAEGVEEEAQARALTRLGCPLAQGYLYSTPVPATGDRCPARSGDARDVRGTWSHRFAPPVRLLGTHPAVV